MNYIFATLILVVWAGFCVSMAWKPTSTTFFNIFYGLLCCTFLGVVYWVPFWLLFLK